MRGRQREWRNFLSSNSWSTVSLSVLCVWWTMRKKERKTGSFHHSLRIHPHWPDHKNRETDVWPVRKAVDGFKEWRECFLIRHSSFLFPHSRIMNLCAENVMKKKRALAHALSGISFINIKNNKEVTAGQCALALTLFFFSFLSSPRLTTQHKELSLGTYERKGRKEKWCVSVSA